ncbi:WSC-domain-containing protein [Polychaeton citri CBS 116435]|uniref:WSC-domain-containing protein n=1 Tax=Polychaeton citri CBS 116435 TaxID=1314669 RepID=A0A9P4QA35_9PEZI|nr:WSC-domain-containing protein [Polychaeton citri CBS 116435]
MIQTSHIRAAFAAAALLAVGHAAPSPQAAAGTLAYKGCYSSSSGMSDIGSYTWQSSGYCQKQCTGQNQAVMALSAGSDCSCGGELPPSSALVDDSKCSINCNGWPDDKCGGSGFYSVYLTGTSDDVPTAGGSSDSNSGSGSSDTSNSATSAAAAAPITTQPVAAVSPSPTATQAPSIITSVAPGRTVVITQPAAAENTAPVSTTTSTPTPEAAEKKKGSNNTAGIAAGVVVGVIAVAAIAGGLFFFLRHKRRQQQEEENKKTQVSDFMRAGNANGMTYEHKSPGTAGGWSTLSDSRLDPELANGRRNSVGSIADDQDYSRRILRVANPS